MTLPDNAELVKRLTTHVDRLAGLIGPRHPGNPRMLNAAATYIETELRLLGDDVRHETYAVSDGIVANLIVERPGTSRPGEIVIVGAHYDTLPQSPGADDNASAVAMLIEVARLLQGGRAARTLRLIAFTCEEPPYFHLGQMGSQEHARGCRARGERVVAMLSLEMVGYYTDAPGSQRLPPGIPRGLRWAFPSRGNFLAAVANPRSWRVLWTFRRGFKRASRFPLFTVALPERIQEIRRSDNSSFWDQGYPALMITDTSFLRNANYHEATDTPDTLDYVRMAEATRGVAGGVARLCGMR
ncbi:MAG: M28 family peptidase [Planctomyces sp.]|nr:M28 family peptidase [Planctomyces sp.]